MATSGQDTPVAQNTVSSGNPLMSAAARDAWSAIAVGTAESVLFQAVRDGGQNSNGVTGIVVYNDGATDMLVSVKGLHNKVIGDANYPFMPVPAGRSLTFTKEAGFNTNAQIQRVTVKTASGSTTCSGGVVSCR